MLETSKDTIGEADKKQVFIAQ